MLSRFWLIKTHRKEVLVLLYKKDNLTSYALGSTVCFELLKSRPNIVRRVIAHSKLQADLLARFDNLCKSQGLSIELNDRIFAQLTKKENVYIACEFEKYSDELISGNHIVLVNPQDAGNLGNAMRTAAAFQIDGVAIITPAVDLFDPKTVRASMGAMFLVKTQHFYSFSDYCAQQNNREYLPFMLNARLELSDYNFQTSKNYSMIFGNEATGLPVEYEKVGTPLKIAQSQSIDSLNITTAIAIAAYSCSRKNLKF